MKNIIEPIAAICFGVMAFFALNFAVAQQTPVQNPPVGAPSTSASSPVAGDTPDTLGNVNGGNPVKSGCLITTTLPTYTNNQLGTEHCTTRGEVLFSPSVNGVAQGFLPDNGDGVAVTGVSRNAQVIGRNTVFNGTTWDRLPGNVNGAFINPYAQNSVPETASTIGTTAATTATLAAAVGKTTYICGFTITSDATAALAGNATVTGTIGGTLNYIQNVGSATSAGSLQQTYSPCVPASATNTAVSVNSVAAGTGGNTAVTAWGFQL